MLSWITVGGPKVLSTGPGGLGTRHVVRAVGAGERCQGEGSVDSCVVLGRSSDGAVSPFSPSTIFAGYWALGLAPRAGKSSTHLLWMEKPCVRIKLRLGRETPSAIVIFTIEPSLCHIVCVRADRTLTIPWGDVSSGAWLIQPSGSRGSGGRL